MPQLKKIPVLSHHQAVDISYQGTTSKTRPLSNLQAPRPKQAQQSCCRIFYQGKKKVVSHGEQGSWRLEYRGWIIRKGLSINTGKYPDPHLMPCRMQGLDFDAFVAEYLTCGTGSADMGIITTIAIDYKIANNTKLASWRKSAGWYLMPGPGSVLVVNNDALRFFGSCRRIFNVVSFTGFGSMLHVMSIMKLGWKSATIAYFLGKEHGKDTYPTSPVLLTWFL